MKTTTRCGSATVDAINAHLVAVAGDAGLVDVSRVRADTTVVPAGIRYPTDSGLLTRGVARIARLVARLQAAGTHPLTRFDDPAPIAREAAHRSKLRRRSDHARTDVLVITGELADLAGTVCAQAKRVLANAARGGDRPVRRLRRMLADLEHLLDAVGEIIAQTRQRLAGDTPRGRRDGCPSSTATPAHPQGQPRNTHPVRRSDDAFDCGCEPWGVGRHPGFDLVVDNDLSGGDPHPRSRSPLSH